MKQTSEQKARAAFRRGVLHLIEEGRSVALPVMRRDVRLSSIEGDALRALFVLLELGDVPELQLWPEHEAPAPIEE